MGRIITPDFWDFRGRRFVAMIGSRGAPQEALDLMGLTAEVLCDSGIAITSGDADGCDLASYTGATRSASFPLVGARIYLPWNGVGYQSERPKRFADNRIFFDASKFENYAYATELAHEARGSWEGLKRGGIAMQCRNPYQILLDDLKTPVASCIFWAIPVGKKGLVKGGTNTAVQVARKFGVPTVNLYTDEGMEKIQAFLKKKGRNSP